MGSCAYQYSAICMYIYIYIYIYIHICSYDNIHDGGVWMFLFSLHFHLIENGSFTGGIILGYFSSEYKSNSLGTPGGL